MKNAREKRTSHPGLCSGDKTEATKLQLLMKIISKKAANIETKEKAGKTMRLILLSAIILSCLCGIFIGVSEKSKFIETQYQEYIKAPKQSALNDELLSYKDVSKQFEALFLGNQSCQSLMGGFFYEGEDCSACPDEDGQKTILRLKDKEVTLCEGLASDINVKDGSVYYRKLNSRNILAFTISTGETIEMPIKNAGQFVICGEKLYYIDLATSSLMTFTMATSETVEIVHAEVSSFVIAGNNIIYLSSNHILYELNLSNHTKTIINKNIAEFMYNGNLWFQNNEKIYSKSLYKKIITDVSFGIQCNRLLGITDTQMFVESEDGIYACNIKTNTSRKIAEGVFIGASDEKLLMYNLSDSSYQVIDLV